MLRQYKLKDYKFRLILWVAAISVLGIMVIGSAQDSVQKKQIFGLGIGLVLMVTASLADEFLLDLLCPWDRYACSGSSGRNKCKWCDALD